MRAVRRFPCANRLARPMDGRLDLSITPLGHSGPLKAQQGLGVGAAIFTQSAGMPSYL